MTEQDRRIGAIRSANKQILALARTIGEILSEPAPELPVPDPVPADPVVTPPNLQGTTLRVQAGTRDEQLELVRIARDQPVLEVRTFINTSGTGGQEEVVVALCNGNPEGKGSIVLPPCKVYVGRQLIEDFGGERLMIRPGDMKVCTHYRGGFMQFWEKFPNGPSPGEQFNDMLKAHLDQEIARQPDAGHYTMGWPHDPQGNAGGGAGIEPFWHLWRNNKYGRAIAALEMYRTAERQFRLMTNDIGELDWDEDQQYTTLGFFMPPAFAENPRRTDLPDYAGALYAYRGHDDQHLHRAYRAAVWLARICDHSFARWYLSVLLNFQAAAFLNSAGDQSSSGWWSLDKRIDSTVQGGRSEHCGRGGVHQARLAHACRSLGITPVTAEALSNKWDRLFLRAADEQGRAYARVAGSVDATKDIPGWDNRDMTAQVRELQLALVMYEESENTQLYREAPRLRRWLGPYPPKIWNYTQEAGTQELADPSYALMTHGVMEHLGGKEGMLRIAATRGVDAGGAQPLNSCRSVSMWI
jgi:hypothetical protein